MREWDEKTVFLQALALSPGQREGFLAGACPDDAARDRIRTLLRHHDEAAGHFLAGGSADGVDAASAAVGAVVDESATADPPPRIPEQIDEFKIVHRLGEGGMGVVYLAEDAILGRRVALKVLARHMVGSEQALARFREEARSAAALKHPAIVPIFKFGRDGDLCYLVCEYVEGQTLAELIAAKREGARLANSQDARAWHRRAAEIAAVIADALDCAHRARIVHRDVKPSNILIDAERGPRLTDFGIAKHLTEEARTAATGLVGSCHYMSPEQAGIAGVRIDQRSDVFSLGVVLYEMLALKRPFDGASVQQVLRAIGECSPPRLRALDRRIPRDLETICHKAMEKQPADRYQTAAHVAADLRCYLGGDPILARPPGWLRRMRRVVGRHRAAAAIGAVVIMASAMAALAWRLESARDERVAWFSVESDAGLLTVFVQSIDADTGEVNADAMRLGTTPLRGATLSAGYYRVTVSTADGGSFAEYNVLALETGRGHERHLHVAEKSKGSAARAAAGATTSLEAVLVRPADVASTMVTIPDGEYPTGQADQSFRLTTARRVRLAGFMIDRAQVSNREYKEFADATGRVYPRYWIEGDSDVAQSDRPVTAVTLDDCEAYARWRGKRLPTHLEWQAAARGATARLYPWGDSIAAAPPEFTAYSVDLAAEQARGQSVRLDAYWRYVNPVHSFDPLTCTHDVLHVFGDVRDITSTIDMERRDYVGLGRCWSDHPRHNTLADAWTFPLDATSIKNGFRCAKSLAPPFAGRIKSE